MANRPQYSKNYLIAYTYKVLGKKRCLAKKRDRVAVIYQRIPADGTVFEMVIVNSPLLSDTG
jgi:hypothetical protein